jgi:HEAT repeat protein
VSPIRLLSVALVLLSTSAWAGSLTDDAAQIAASAPDQAAAIRQATTVPTRVGSLRFVGAPVDADLAPLWLDLALHEDASVEVRIARAKAASPWASSEHLSTAFAQARDARVRAALLGGLRDTPQDTARAVLVPALQDPDANVRAVATSVLGRRMDGASWLDALRPLQSDPDPQVAALAARAFRVFQAD